MPPQVLDLRIYRAAFIPVVLALVVVAFSLQTRPRPLDATLPPDAFDGARAATVANRLAERFPLRRPGSEGDLALAGEVQRTLQHAGFSVTSFDEQAETIDGERTLRTVVGERTGASSRRVVVVAHRDAATAPALAELSGTASLLELARLFAGRTTERTLTLVSTSGGTGGAGGAAAWADRLGGSVDAVLVLGDLGGEPDGSPQVVGWSNGRGIAPQKLMRTVSEAVRRESGPPGASGPVMQWLRLAFPLTVSEQGVLDQRGIPAVLLGASGELGPSPAEGVDETRLEGLGRAALRSITALDAGPDVEPREPQSVVVVRNQELPAWAVRLLVGVLLLPPVVTVLDGLARVRRRREPVLPWIGWVAATAVPFVIAALVAILLRLTGLVTAPGAPVAPGLIPTSIPALVGIAAVFALAFALLWPRVARALALGRPDAAGAGVAVALVAIAVAVIVWLFNPFAALFLVPAAHLWLLCGDAGSSMPRWLRLAGVLVALVPPALAALLYGLALDAGPVALAWMGVLLVAGGHVGVVSLLLWSVVAACAVTAIVVATRITPAPRGPQREEVRSRGPISYAGPGSLGGTDSALRR
ncbi:MAG TPA: hypothetical protein VFR97_04600 [Capillimicrobium sp.]|nr:hypothetical protein [Capillimicrobium sp.]